MRKVFTTKGQGRYGKTKNSLEMQERMEAWIHVYTLIMLLVRGWVLDTYLHDERNRGGTGSDRGREGKNERETKPKVG